MVSSRAALAVKVSMRLLRYFYDHHVYPPLISQDNLSETTVHMMKCMAPQASHIVLRKGNEFWDAARTIEELHKGNYFDMRKEEGLGKTTKKTTTDIRHWPSILRAVVEGGKDGSMALSALGGATWHTRRALIDHDLLSMQRFGAYIPLDLERDGKSALAGADVAPNTTRPDQGTNDLPSASSLPGSSTEPTKQSHMVLDGVSLSNLEVLRNSFDGGEKGSLWGFINRCSTAFGRRLLKDWVLKPLLIPR